MSRQIYDYVYLDGGFDPVRRVLAGPPESWLPAPARREDASVVVNLTEGGGSIVAAAVTLGQARYETADNRFLIPIAWEARSRAALYPKMTATLELSALSHDRSQLTLVGEYRVPAGALGEVVDRAAGHAIVEGVVHDLLTRIAARLELAVSTLTT